MFDTYAEIFEARARSYHSAMEAFPDARDAEFRCVLGPLDDLPAGTLCDMPAGGGYLARRLRTDLAYIGVDPASDFVACGSRAARIVKAETSDVPLESASVDYVVSLAGLHHEPNLGPVFREMRRLVRDGGRVVIADVAHDTAPARFLNGFVARANPMGHDGRFLNDDTAALLEAAGFRIAEDALVGTPWTFADPGRAGHFARQLFGTDDATAAEVTEALARDIGFTPKASRLQVDWCLRRIICVAD